MILYDLFAVVNHHGEMDSGHYTSYVLQNGTWCVHCFLFIVFVYYQGCSCASAIVWSKANDRCTDSPIGSSAMTLPYGDRY